MQKVLEYIDGNLERMLELAELASVAFDRIRRIDRLPEQYPRHQERNLEHDLTQIVGMQDEQKPA